MKLLIITQKVDIDDPVLGFFHHWIEEFAKRFEKVTVICLAKGQYDLPGVKVLSLGKEKMRERSDLKNSKRSDLEEQFHKLIYIFRFYKYIWQVRKNYDAVFVHMNQEYVLLGGVFWKIFRKKIFMWRNHYKGNFLTGVAAIFCDKVFCTSKYSYTAKYKKTVLMPVGIDTNLFIRIPDVKRIKNSILFLGRMAPSKKPDLLIEALIEIRKQGIEFKASFYGDALATDQEYYSLLKATVENRGLSNVLAFYPGVSNEKTIEIYNRHEVFINLSPSGMYDKTIFEAMACETLVLASNKNLHGFIDEQLIFEEGDKEELTAKLISILLMQRENRMILSNKLRKVVINNHSLKLLMDKLKTSI